MVVHLGFMDKSFNRGTKSFLNSDPLSKTTFFGLGYLEIHVWSNSLLILADDLSMNVLSINSLDFSSLSSLIMKLGTSTISNHPVTGSNIGMQVSWRFTSCPEPSGWYCSIVTV